MAKEFSKAFYDSKAWHRCRAELVADRILCERCRANGRVTPGVIGHHIVELTPENINDPSIALDQSNLMLLCNACHNIVHGRESDEDLMFDAEGQPIPPKKY